MAMAQTAAPRARRWARVRDGPAQPAAALAEAPPAPSAPARRPPTPDRRDLTGLGAGDSYLLAGFLGLQEADEALRCLTPVKLGGLGEVPWMQMYGANGKAFGRLKFTQAALEGSQEPLYRYPTNNQAACPTEAWSPSVEALKKRVESAVGQAMNHCVGNLYQDQGDFIGPHTDKMLDIQRGSCIVSLSLGAGRPMVLERKADRGQRQEVPLPHGSLFVIGPRTNHEWLHSIPSQPGRLGHRISLTIRQVGSFRDRLTGEVTGQGAASQAPNWPEWSHNLDVVPTVVHPRSRALAFAQRASHSEEGSSFERLLLPCTDLDEVRQRQRQLREEHPEACHIPHAWVLLPGGAREPLMGSCSDGEPELPRRGLVTGRDGVLEPLLRSGWRGCAAFAVRRWDGRRLGAERLVRAYAQVTAAAAAASDDREG